MKARLIANIGIVFFFLISPGLQSCGTNVGNGVVPPGGPAAVQLSFKAYTAQTGAQMMGASVTQLTLCLKRLRFKLADGSVGDNVDLTLGAVTLSPSGTQLTSLTVPAATYTQLEFDIDNSCPSGLSVQLTNSQGTFTTTDGMTIKFQGNMAVNQTSQALAMSVQAIINALGPVASGTAIKNAAEGSSGSF